MLKTKLSEKINSKMFKKRHPFVVQDSKNKSTFSMIGILKCLDIESKICMRPKSSNHHKRRAQSNSLNSSWKNIYSNRYCSNTLFKSND